MAKSIKKIIKNKGHVAYSGPGAELPKNVWKDTAAYLEITPGTHLTKSERKSLNRNNFEKTRPSVFSKGKSGYQKETTAGKAQKYVAKGHAKGAVINDMGIKVQNMGAVNYTSRPNNAIVMRHLAKVITKNNKQDKKPSTKDNGIAESVALNEKANALGGYPVYTGPVINSTPIYRQHYGKK